MEGVDEPSNQKKNIILMMCLCVALGLVGQFSQHWLVDDVNQSHSSLSTTYWENSWVDENGQMTNEGKFSEDADVWCDNAALIDEDEFDREWMVELCDNLSSLRDSGRLGSVLLLLGTATGLWFLVVAYRSIGGDRRNLSSAFLDPRFCLAAGGSTTLAAVIWRIMANDAISDFEAKVGTGFYITLVGGLLGIGSYLMISRLQEGENEESVEDESRESEVPDSMESSWSAPVREDGAQSDLNIAKGAVIAIVLSLFLPYLSMGGITPSDYHFRLSGIQMIGYWGEIAQVISEFNPAELEAETCPYADDGECDEPFLCAEGTDGNDCGSSSGSSLPAEAESVPLRSYMLMLGALMVMVSPLVFLLSAIVGGVFTFSSGVLPKTLGKLHLGFFVVMILMIMIGGTIMSDIFADNEPELPSSMLGFTGIGIWIGGLSGIGFFYDRDELSKLDNDSTTGGIIIDGSLKLIQNPVKSPGELSDEHRKVGSKCSELECKSTVMYKSKFCYKHRNIE